MDRTEIYRRACYCLGQYDFKEGTPTEAAHKEYKAALGEACAMHNWTFTARYAELQRVQGAACEAIGKALYKLPLDCMKLVQFLKADGQEVREPELCADGLMVPEDEADGRIVVRYHCDLLGDVSVLDESRTVLFVEGLVRLLASKIAMVVTSNAQLGQQLALMAQEYFYKAITADRQQDWSNAVNPGVIRKRNRKSYLN